MLERDNKVVFEDGHEEKIVYFENSPMGMIFVTRTGEYLYRKELTRYAHVTCPIESFYRINFAAPKVFSISDDLGSSIPVEFIRVPIKAIYLDERIEYEYALFKNEDDKEPYTTGTILIEPNASDIEIRLAIVKDQLGFDPSVRWVRKTNT